ncbi:hydroxyethylthiazole kinase [Brevibacterium samyangense]|uniref:Hydroxyethylthiazole kinase n=1 Tax=Brevibacterium samyangense TaxID=366888 RepID=A0ABP5ENP7_9MICO
MAASAHPFDMSAAHRRVRTTTPLVQCITNTVVQQFTANVLLATGASPAMLDHEADAAQFAGLANGILVNYGTATSHQFLGAEAAIGVANHIGTPWVLDPVSVGAVDYRTSRIRAAAERRPTAVRGNASEVAALAGMGLGGRGVDSTDSVDAVLPAAALLSARTGGVVAVSGEVDAIVLARPGTGTSAETAPTEATVVRVAGGSALMPLVIGTGCSLGGVVAAYLGAAKAAGHRVREGASAVDTGVLRAPGTATDAALEAVVAAHAHFAAAGARAGERAQAPGSFAVTFLDALYEVSDEDLDAVEITATTVGVPA